MKKKILCFVEMNSSTGFGHYSRISTLINILGLKKIDIITKNYHYAKKYFRGHKIIENKNFLNFCGAN